MGRANRVIVKRFLLPLLFLFPVGASAQEAPRCPTIPAAQIDRLRQEQDPLFLDVREAKELQDLGTLEGYVHIPIGELESRLAELPKDRPILVA